MSRNKLTDAQKQHICACYTAPNSLWTQDALSALYSVSRKTIYRVLQQAGVLPTPQVLSPGSARIVEVAKAHGLDAEQLAQVLDAPLLSRNNMIAVLAKMDYPDLKVLFDDVVQLKHQNNHGTVTHEPTDPSV